MPKIPCLKYEERVLKFDTSIIDFFCIRKERKTMNCPVCNIPLNMMDRSGVEIDYCSKCRGVWLDRGELDKIIERAAAAPGSNFSSPNQTQNQSGFSQQNQPPGFNQPNQPGFNQPNQSGFNQPYQSGFNQHRIHDSDEPHYGHHKKHKKHESFLGELFDF
jgi:uncharacterized protein